MTGTGIGIRTAQARAEREVGQIHLYDGEGKGKSQAALGVVLRTIGLGIGADAPARVLLLRFLKGPDRSYDEDAAIAALQAGFPHLIDQVRTGRAEYFDRDGITEFDHAEAQRGWDIAKGAIASGLYSVVVLDELNPVLDLELLPAPEVLRTLRRKPEGLELIVTGRGAPPKMRDLADLHSEMQSHSATDVAIEGIELYSGAGKGKSTSALGKALQAIGRGIRSDKSHRVLIVQWLKGGTGYTEDAAIAALKHSYPDLVDHQRCGRDAIVWRGQQQEVDCIEARRGWEIAKVGIASGTYKTVILDELNPTVELELLGPDGAQEVTQALLHKPPNTQVIVTGRCRDALPYFNLASLYSEMVCHKHYAERGVDLKRGVDY